MSERIILVISSMTVTAVKAVSIHTCTTSSLYPSARDRICQVELARNMLNTLNEISLHTIPFC